jgi:tRNA (cmo5U34)-methyltransferase
VSETAQAYWGARAAEYDDFIRRVVPRYDEMMERLLEGVPRTAVSVLELGCGTGNLSQRLVALVPGARFTFVDAAPEMAAAVRARLQAVAPAAAARSTFVVTTFEEFEPEPGAFDLVVAGLSLHHVADLGPVYRSIGRSLRPGGFFRSCDGVRAASAAQHGIERTRWEAFWREGSRLSDEEIASVTEHVARHDHYEPLADHFRMLEEAGLHAPDCLWRDGMFAVIAAQGADPSSPSGVPLP